MNNTFFEDIKSAGLTGAAGRARRVGHSFAQYFQSMDRTTVGIKEGMNPLKNGYKAFGKSGVMGAASSGAGMGMNAVGALGTAVAIAAAAGASGAFIAAVSGPQAGIVVGVIGLALLAKSTYSNRESAHLEITKYCWNLIDDNPPITFTGDTLNAASSAALTLLDDGANQIKLLGSKLDETKKKLDALNAQIGVNERAIATLAGKNIGTVELKLISDKKTATEKLIDDGMKQGGAIYDYARRVVHTGNYIQAAHIVSLAMKEKFSPGSVVGKATPDYFANTALGTTSRKFFQDLSKLYEEVTKIPTDKAGGAAAVARAGQGKFSAGGAQLP